MLVNMNEVVIGPIMVRMAKESTVPVCVMLHLWAAPIRIRNWPQNM